MGSYNVAMQRNVYLLHLSVMELYTVKMATMNQYVHVVGHCPELVIIIPLSHKLQPISINYI